MGSGSRVRVDTTSARGVPSEGSAGVSLPAGSGRGSGGGSGSEPHPASQARSESAASASTARGCMRTGLERRPSAVRVLSHARVRRSGPWLGRGQELHHGADRTR